MIMLTMMPPALFNTQRYCCLFVVQFRAVCFFCLFVLCLVCWFIIRSFHCFACFFFFCLTVSFCLFLCCFVYFCWRRALPRTHKRTNAQTHKLTNERTNSPSSVIPFLVSFPWWLTGWAFFLPLLVAVSHVVPYVLVRKIRKLHGEGNSRRQYSSTGGGGGGDDVSQVAPTPTFGAPRTPPSPR